ncbi:MAG: acyl carrier protein [Candidatus Rokubacteria bacterium]|nr:acyl carrier protein [Candidatus Rokubacteria bacterium]
MTIERTLRKYICNELMFEEDESRLAVDAPLLEQGIIDSLRLLQLVQFMEEQFGVSIADTDLVPENFYSVTALTRLVGGKQGREPVGAR